MQLNTSAVDGKTCKGETISINCLADAVPSVTSYELFENDSMIMGTSGMWSRTLSLAGVFIYKCVANNSLGSRQSESVTVTVNGKQSFLLKTDYDVYFLIRVQKYMYSAVHVCSMTGRTGLLLQVPQRNGRKFS